jgi:hypothetical protein
MVVKNAPQVHLKQALQEHVQQHHLNLRGGNEVAR